MTDFDLTQLVRNGWTQIMAIVAIIWWSRWLDLRSKDHSARLDRHEARLRDIEANAHAHAVQFARIDETLSGIKLTLDRIYAEVSETRNGR